MKQIDKKMAAVKRLQEEMEHRKEVEKEAETLICEGEFEKATALLATLDDSVVKELAEAVEADAVETGTNAGEKHEIRKRYPNMGLQREAFEKFMCFLEGLHISMSFRLGKKMRVVMIYDPQKPSVHFYQLTDNEQIQDVPEY